MRKQMFVHRERSERSTASDGAECSLARQRKKDQSVQRSKARSHDVPKRRATTDVCSREFTTDELHLTERRAQKTTGIASVARNRNVSSACPTTQEREPALHTAARPKKPPFTHNETPQNKRAEDHRDCERSEKSQRVFCLPDNARRVTRPVNHRPSQKATLHAFPNAPKGKMERLANASGEG